MDRYEKILKSINNFVDDRDWKQFHNPKDITTALSIEASELLELFLWIKESDLKSHVEKKRGEISDELADVAVYLFELADILGIDIFQAIEKKMKKNEAKYPIEKSKGNNKKYTEI